MCWNLYYPWYTVDNSNYDISYIPAVFTIFGISIDASAGCVAIQIGILKAAVTTKFRWSSNKWSSSYF
jgi:hypothetical protein